MRVKAAFDVLTESVVLLDNGERIVLANRAFGVVVGKDPNELVGKRLDEFSWTSVSPAPPLTVLPWKTARKEKCVELDFPIMLPSATGKSLKFRVNCTPILNDQEQVQGVLVSFADVTKLEETISALESSKADMESLAMRDPLTGIFNRRALFEAFEDLYSVSSSRELRILAALWPISIILNLLMIDLGMPLGIRSFKWSPRFSPRRFVPPIL